MRSFLVGMCAVLLLAGCARVQTQTFGKAATRDRRFGNIQRVAVFPFETFSEEPASPKNTENTLIQELLSLQTFESIEEPRYIASLMKKLKLRSTDVLDRETVKKIGQELDVDALILGAHILNGTEDVSTNVEFSIYLRILEVSTGDIVWSGSTFVRANTTWAEVFGLSEGPSINELAVGGALDLADEIDDQFVDARDLEYNILIEDLPPEDGSDDEEMEELDGEPEEDEEVEELLLKVAPK